MAIAATPARTWSSDSISDEGFRARFVTVPEIIEQWVAPYGALRGKSLLDFGCGHGISALAFALHHDVRVVGVDIMPDPEDCLPRARAQLGLDALPPNLSLHRAQPGEAHRIPAQFDIDILRTHYTQDDAIPPKRLAQIFDPRVLTTNQVALLARRR